MQGFLGLKVGGGGLNLHNEHFMNTEHFYTTGCIKKVDNFETALNLAKRLQV